MRGVWCESGCGIPGQQILYRSIEWQKWRGGHVRRGDPHLITPEGEVRGRESPPQGRTAARKRGGRSGGVVGVEGW